MKDKRSGIFKGNYFDVCEGKASMVYGLIKNIRDLEIPLAVIDVLNEDYKIINEAYTPVAQVGINNMTKEKDLAIQFLQHLFLKDMQVINNDEGFPVNRGALKNWIEEDNTSSTISISSTILDEKGQPKRLDLVWPDKKKRYNLLQKIERLKNEIASNQVIVDMILAGTEAFMMGESSAEECAAAIV